MSVEVWGKESCAVGAMFKELREFGLFLSDRFMTLNCTSSVSFGINTNSIML